MSQKPDDGMSEWAYGTVRKWLVRVVVMLIAVEAVYLVAANALLRTGLLLDLINAKPERTQISWSSAVSYLPGFATVTGFELRSQTRRDQVYVRVEEADARISLVKLALKTIHIRGVDARGVDFRYRPRLDRPPKQGETDRPPDDPDAVQHWPEIPGWTNPPDPNPDELYPRKKKKRPWTIKITGAEVDGPISVALATVRIEGDGVAGGGVTVKPRRSITIHRGRLGLESTTVRFGSEIVTDDLTIGADVRIDGFPAKRPELADILDGVSGRVTVSGRIGEQIAVSHPITPGLSIKGAGDVDVELQLRDGVLRDGSRYSLSSDGFQVRVMGVEATGSATVEGSTTRDGRDHVTELGIVFDDFGFRDPEAGAVAVEGSGLELDARWDELSLAARSPASRVVLTVPSTRIVDIGAFNSLLPEQIGLSLDSGTGTVGGRLEVADRVAMGDVDLVADDVALTSHGTPLVGDLKVRVSLAEGDLESRRFDLGGTTIRVEDIIDRELSDKKQARLKAWHCDVAFASGTLTFGKPMAADGHVDLAMRDTRPLLALLKKLDVGPGWLSVAPNIENVDGAVDLDVDRGLFALENLEMSGDGFETLGWVRIENKEANARLFVKLKAVTAGVQLDRGKAKIILAKPRRWFDAQPSAP